MKNLLVLLSLISLSVNAQPKKISSRIVIAPTSTTTVVDTAYGFGVGTTGGGTSSPVTVTTKSAFQSAVSGTSSKVIIVSGKIKIDYTIIGSNTTIYGVGNNDTLIGTLRCENGSNVIIYNLYNTAPVISGTDQDAISFSNFKHFWVHNCEIVDWTDGAIDITNASDSGLISLCKFRQTTDYVHSLANLVGSSNTATGDAGKLKVTWNLNNWAENCKDRMPRVRYGKNHVYNNYYHSYTPTIPKVSAYITAAIESQVLSQNNYFENGEDPIYKISGENGKIRSSGDYFAPSVTGAKTGTDVVFTPAYPYTLLSPSAAKTYILSHAGTH